MKGAMDMIQWEYKSVKFEPKGFLGGVFDTEEFEQAANANGRDGWELVSCFDTSYSQGASRNIVAVFKRPLN